MQVHAIIYYLFTFSHLAVYYIHIGNILYYSMEVHAIIYYSMDLHNIFIIFYFNFYNAVLHTCIYIYNIYIYCKKKIRKKKRTCWQKITRSFSVKFTDISFNIKQKIL